MTTLVQMEIRCAICGQVSSQAAVASTNQFGSPDLDLRPPEMARSTMRCWLQHCQGCGFVAPNLNHADDGVQEMLSSASYRSALCDSSMPELARLFVCRSLIEHALGQFREAFSRQLAAAWVCDDANLSGLAVKCREQAAVLIEGSAELNDEDRLRLLDVLRRAAKWDEAERLVQELSSEPLDKRLLDIVGFQHVLIHNREDSCHCLREVFAEDVRPHRARDPAPPNPIAGKISLLKRWWRRAH